MRFLSFGGGVQSSALLMLSLTGDEPRFDGVIFADTGWEPRAVYEHLERMERRCEDAGVPFYRVSDGNIRDLSERDPSALGAPFHFKGADESKGMSSRLCTRRLKVRPIRRKIRAEMKAAGQSSAEQAIGISIDEVQRMRDSPVKYVRNTYPLIERQWTRQRCSAYLTGLGIEVARSACIGCPFHSDAEWRALRERPDEWADAVAWEREVQERGLHMNRVPFLHTSRVPLEEVDLSTPEDRGQLSLLDYECEGMCGV